MEAGASGGQGLAGSGGGAKGQRGLRRGRQARAPRTLPWTLVGSHHRNWTTRTMSGTKMRSGWAGGEEGEPSSRMEALHRAAPSRPSVSSLSAWLWCLLTTHVTKAVLPQCVSVPCFSRGKFSNTDEFCICFQEDRRRGSGDRHRNGCFSGRTWEAPTPPSGASGPSRLLRNLRETKEVHVHLEGVVAIYLHRELYAST